MPREGWIHALAFLAVLGVGVLLILPRLGRPPERTPEEFREPLAPTGDEPGEGGPGAADFAPRPAYDWIRVSVSGVGGPLRGPFRAVEGADVEAETGPEAPVQVLRVRPTAPYVTFGAVGHQWRTVSTAQLQAGAADSDARVELPTAAPPLVVRVREVGGEPAGDVPVRVEPAAPGPAPRTDEGGTLVLDHLPPGLVILDGSTSERHGPRLRVQAGVDRDVRLVLEPAWRVQGRLVDRSGDALPGARVEAFGPAGDVGRVTTTGADGRFVWHGPALARIALRFRARGWGEHGVEAAPPAVGPLITDLGEVRLQMAGVTVVGTVAAAFLEPGAHVTVEPAVAAHVRELFGDGQVLDRPRRAELGEDGRFVFHDLPAQMPLRVAVRGAGVPVDAIVEGAAGEEVPVELQPPPGESLAGTLRLSDGRPAVGVRMLLSDVPRDGDALRAGDFEVVSGADGTFLQRGLAAGRWYVRAYAAGSRSLLHRVELPRGAPLDLAFGAVESDATRRVQGRIHDGLHTDVKMKGGDPWVGEAANIQYGRPLAGVTVRAAGLTTLTDAQGRFMLDSVESLAPEVTLAYGFEAGTLGSEDPRAYLPQEEVDVKPGGEALALVLLRGATLRFRALDAIDDRPLAFVHVVVRTDLGRIVVDRGIAPHDGVVELTGLPPRGLELTVLAQGRRFRRSPIALQPGQTQDLGDLLMDHGLRVEGRVLGPQGRPVPGARLGAFGLGWQHAEQDPGRERELLFRTTVTDVNGRFRLEGFDPRKPVDLAVWSHGFAPTYIRVDRAAPGEAVTGGVEVALVPGAYLALDLYQAGPQRGRGPRIHGAFLDIEHAADGSDWLDLVHRGLLGGPLGDTGRWRWASEQLLHERRGTEGYVLGPVRPGPYALWVERPGFESLRTKLTVIDPEQAVLVDVMQGTETKMSGRVTRIGFELEPAR